MINEFEKFALVFIFNLTKTMIKVTVITKYKDNLENSAINAAMDGLKEMIKSSIEQFTDAIKREGGLLSVEISGIDRVNVKMEGLSKKLQKDISEAISDPK